MALTSAHPLLLGQKGSIPDQAQLTAMDNYHLLFSLRPALLLLIDAGPGTGSGEIKVAAINIVGKRLDKRCSYRTADCKKLLQKKSP